MNVENLYLQMEGERGKLPNITRQDFIPQFIVKLLHEAGGGVPNSKDNSMKWDGDSLIQEMMEIEASFLLPMDRVIRVEEVLSFSVKVCKIFKVDSKRIWKCFMQEIECPSFELLWFMDAKYGVLSITSYLMMLKHPPELERFKCRFVAFCFVEKESLDDRDRCRNILDYFWPRFVASAYCNEEKTKCLKNLKKVAAEILSEVSGKLVEKKGVLDSSRKSLLSVIEDACIPCSLKKKFWTDQMFQLLTKFDEGDERFELDEIIRYQERFAAPTFTMDFPSFNDAISTMMDTPMTNDEINEILLNVLMKSTEINWNRMFHFISEWIQKAEYGATSVLKEIVKCYIREGFSELSEVKVTLAFVLARHCSLVSPKIFTRYEKWYSNIFESETYSPAKGAESFKFFVNLLNRWIPFEPGCFLQVQASLWPFIPQGCLDIWREYVGLARVRVAEYNEVEDAMELEPNANNPILHDVEMAIKDYENTRNIPHRVIHMFMFKKQYYRDQFLPVLLKTPPGTCLSDARQRLIECLNQSGKLPSDLYKIYKQIKD